MKSFVFLRERKREREDAQNRADVAPRLPEARTEYFLPETLASLFLGKDVYYNHK